MLNDYLYFVGGIVERDLIQGNNIVGTITGNLRNNVERKLRDYIWLDYIQIAIDTYYQ